MSTINTSASGFLKETKRYPTVIAGAVLLGIILLIAVLTPLLSNTDPSYIDAARRAQPASESHWFGTDMLGRDLYTRVLYGAPPNQPYQVNPTQPINNALPQRHVWQQGYVQPATYEQPIYDRRLPANSQAAASAALLPVRTQ